MRDDKQNALLQATGSPAKSSRIATPDSVSKAAKRELDPDISRHIDWLLNGPVRLPSGLLAAWVDKSGPSYPYQEATAYLISLLCLLYRLTGRDRFGHEAASSMAALIRDTRGKEGCGRDGLVYLFDTVVGLRAAETFSATFPQLAEGLAPLADRSLIELWTRSARKMFRLRKAFWGGDGGALANRWSGTFNVHLIKAAAQLWLIDGSAENQSRLSGIVETLISERYDGGLFLTHLRKQKTYLHSHCYALEGLLALQNRMPGRWDRPLNRAAQRLADLQNDQGGLPRWWPEPEPAWSAPDVTAQAVRIWQAIDPVAFAEPIDRALGYLKTMARPDGGILFFDQADHINSWTTIFTVQALLGQGGALEAEWII